MSRPATFVDIALTKARLPFRPLGGRRPDLLVQRLGLRLDLASERLELWINPRYTHFRTPTFYGQRCNDPPESGDLFDVRHNCSLPLGTRARV